MKFIKFEIENFKGIHKLEIDLESRPNGKIFPLVGLNESGKTTILEAIDFFEGEMSKFKPHDLIHKNKQANFNGFISVKATLELEDSDKKLIDDFLEGKNLQKEKEIKNISITKKYNFSSSNFEENEDSELWNLNLNIKTSRQKNFTPLSKANNEAWQELVLELEKEIPKIIYFENFLFDFPKRIYLEEVPNSQNTSSSIQKEYRKILQDILNKLNGGFNLNEHVLNRMKNDNVGDAASLRKVLNEMEQELNGIIISSWQKVFPNSSEKRVEILSDKDEDKYFLEFKIKENSNSFNINERSLGFRWFFSFLLLTEFRKARSEEKGEYLFLFDEPANNLHQLHQQILLELFEKLTDKAKIIYSTHSHYLLSSKFLLNSFVVKDFGIKEGQVENISQDIRATTYKHFLANYGDKKDHFKPILDVLEYIENPFESGNNVVFLEGKNDYYIFKWIKARIVSSSYDFNFYPGGGVRSYKNLFREYLANNKNFIAVFDDDFEGRRSKKNYVNNISKELENNIFTYKDVYEEFKNFQVENLFTKEEKFKIQKLSFEDSTTYEKSKFNIAIEELFIKEENFVLSEETKQNFIKIFNFIKERLNSTN